MEKDQDPGQLQAKAGGLPAEASKEWLLLHPQATRKSQVLGAGGWPVAGESPRESKPGEGASVLSGGLPVPGLHARPGPGSSHSAQPCRHCFPISQMDTLRLRGAVTGPSGVNGQTPREARGQPRPGTPALSELLHRPASAGGAGQEGQVSLESREKGKATDLESWAPGGVGHRLAQLPALTWRPLNLGLLFYEVGEKSQRIAGHLAVRTRERENGVNAPQAGGEARAPAVRLAVRTPAGRPPLCGLSRRPSARRQCSLRGMCRGQLPRPSLPVHMQDTAGTRTQGRPARAPRWSTCPIKITEMIHNIPLTAAM